LARQYPAAAIVAVDQSPALLTVTGQRLGAQIRRTELVHADFHHMPDGVRDIDLAVAAFCLYHSLSPRRALAQIARCLSNNGSAVVTTKSADSYHDLDALVAATELDADAAHRPSLYASFHSGNAEAEIAAAGLIVRRRLDQQHTFRFEDHDHLAEYLVTCPKYQLPADLTHTAERLADALRDRAPDEPVTTTSTVTYLVVGRP
jgi:SAM-dependent methyltransferase